MIYISSTWWNMATNSLIILLTLMFNINLTNINLGDYNNCAFIVVNDLYCKECLDKIIKSQTLWNNKLRTIVVRKSPRKSRNVKIIEQHINNLIKYDDLIFVESKARDYNKPIKFLGYDCENTPVLFVRYKSRDYYFSYEYLFANKDTIEVRKRLQDSINNILGIE